MKFKGSPIRLQGDGYYNFDGNEWYKAAVPTKDSTYVSNGDISPL